MFWTFTRCLHYSVRVLSTAAQSSKSALSDLRKKTGFTFVNCKNALEKFDYDLVKAEAWLQEEAQKEGWARVSRLQSRPMSQGLLGLIHNGSRATIIEVNCETDFVVKNEKFQRLVSQLATSCHAHFSATSPHGVTTIHKDGLSNIPGDPTSSLSDLVATEVGHIGENMVARRAVHMSALPGATLASYTHIADSDIKEISDCKFGKYATLVEYRPIEGKIISPLSDDAKPSIPPEEAARQISQHIAGMNPTEIGTLPEIVQENSVDIPEIPQDFMENSTVGKYSLETTKSAETGGKYNFESSGGSETVGKYTVKKYDSNVDIFYDDIKNEKNVAGNNEEKKLENACEIEDDEIRSENRENIDMFDMTDVDVSKNDKSDVRNENVVENETMLLRQSFLLDESLSIAEFLDENGIEVLSFVRFECGEELTAENEE